MNETLILEIARMVVQIGIIAFFLYKAYQYLSQTKAIFMFYMVFAYISFMATTEFFRLKVLRNIAGVLFIPFFLALIIVYQADIRHIFVQFSSAPGIIRRRENLISSENLTQILTACYSLANIKRGALIVIRRSDKLANIIDKGTMLDCRISSPALLTIFDHDTPLHDGAVVIDYDKIVAAGCYLPLSEQTNIKSTYGTRHRAALGLTEETDAIVIVVSEENQVVSICYNSRIYADLDMEDAKILLIQFMSYHRGTGQEE